MLKKLSIILAVMTVIIGPDPCNAQIPQLINYQGLLSDGSGNLINGTRSIQFLIYGQETGGTALWTETQTVTALEGLFSALLGSVTPIPQDLFIGTERYMTLKVGSDPEMSPRKRLASVGYSFKSHDADRFAGKDTSEFIQAGQDTCISGEMLKDHTVTAEKISPPVISSVDGVSNDGGNIDLVAGSNITITPDDAANTILISASAGGTAGNTLDQAYDQGGSGAGRTITADAGAVQISGTGGLLVEGKTGIGTVTPQSELDVAGTVTAAAFKGDGSQLSNVGSGHWYGSHPPSVSGNLWRTGNIGIGVSNPTARMDLVAEDSNKNGPTTVLELSHFANPPADGIASRIQMITSSGPHTYRDAAFIDAIMSSLATESSSLAFWTRNAGSMGERMRIDGTGKVGIGTANPSEKLEVIGNIQATNGNIYIKGGNLLRFWNSSNALYGNIYAWGSQLRIQADSGGDVAVVSDAGDGLIVKDNGRVGIGTTNPNGLLDVNGTIYQRGSQLHADYVFEPGYDLESIEDHSDFMWTNRHLKAVPKAARDEAGNEILEIGAHQKGVVEELEKAHIYIARLNERIKELENRLLEMENKM